MSENFYTILTATGKAKLANSAVLGSKVNFKTLKVGDGNGAYYEPTESQTSLVREVWSGNVSSISVDENNPNWIVAETLIPATIGGFFIREAGIFDEDGDLIAISKLSETYKPVVSEGSIKDLCIKIILEVSNVESVTLKIDPTVIVATRKDIDVLQAKMDAASAQTAEEIKELDSKLSEQISDLANEISNKTVITPAVGYGMNNVIKNVGKTSVSPKFTIQGKAVINLLGKDGNCEDASKWSLSQATIYLDSTNKVFGNNGFKVALSSTSGYFMTDYFSKIDKAKYYCISAYIKNGNATNAQLSVNTSGSVGYQKLATVTDSNKFNRVSIKLQPSEIDTKLQIATVVNGASGQYAYVDGIMLEEITQAQYNDPNFQPSPYVDSYACLQNPYIEVRHDNLVRNGNGEEGINWWDYTGNSSFIWDSSNGYFVGTDNDTTINSATKQTMDVVSGKTYIVSLVYKCGTSQDARVAILPSVDSFGNGAQGRIDLTTTSKTDIVVNQPVTIPNGCNKLIIAIGSGKDATTNQSDTGTYMFKNVMLVEGNTIPDSYKTCRIERCIVEGKFADGDSLVLENGEVTGQINWKHKTLFGKDSDWQFNNSSASGVKCIMIPSFGAGYQNFSEKAVKYDGSILPHYDSFTNAGAVSASCLDLPSNRFYLDILNSDSGWSDSINPNNDEVKVFMNGWKSFYSVNNRYVGWVSVTDNSIPPNVPYTTIASTYSPNSTTMVVADASKFSVGDYLALIIGSDGKFNGTNIYGNVIITAINGNTLTLQNGNENTIPVGVIVVRMDNGSTDTRNLNYCKNNVASNYEGYQLHYKLSTPELITDDNCHIHGDIPKLDAGDNYLYLDSGIVLDEVTIVTPNGPNTYAWINANDKYGINQNNSPRSSQLKNKTERIYNVYKNGVNDSNTWVYSDVNLINNAYGNQYIWVTPTTLVDLNATYTADYKILSTIAPQIGYFICNYKQDIVTTINNLEESVNNKQAQNSILDNLIDLSIYENLYGWHVILPWVVTGSGAFFDININLVPKRVIPNTKFKSLRFMCGDIDITSKVIYEPTVSNIKPNYAHFQFHVTEATTISSIRTNGVWCIFDIDFDCRNKL